MRRIFYIISMISLLPLLLYNGYTFINEPVGSLEFSGSAQGASLHGNDLNTIESQREISSLVITSEKWKEDEDPSLDPFQKEEPRSKSIYRKVETDEKVVALTFDDGPDSRYTDNVLDILNQHDVKATFFVVGIMLERHPGTMMRIVKEGHAIGNHTWDHMNLTKLSDDDVIDQVERTSKFIENFTNHSVELVRPPFGSVNRHTASKINAMGYDIINWNVDTRDWDGTPASNIVSIVERETKPGSIILLHSAGGRGGNLDQTIKALPSIIQTLHGKGYRFVTVPELLRLQ